jgi:hypothetical protein
MLQHASKAAQQIGFGGNWLKPIQETAKRPEFWAAVGGTALTAGQSAIAGITAVVTAPATLPIVGGIAAAAGTAYLIKKLSEEDDD